MAVVKNSDRDWTIAVPVAREVWAWLQPAAFKISSAANLPTPHEPRRDGQRRKERYLIASICRQRAGS